MKNMKQLHKSKKMKIYPQLKYKHTSTTNAIEWPPNLLQLEFTGVATRSVQPSLVLSPWDRKSISVFVFIPTKLASDSVLVFSVDHHQVDLDNFDDAKGKDVDLSVYKGKVLLIVNVASQCGLTDDNYKELNEVYLKYKEKGLEILAFPCNQFLAQEPGTNEEIVDFVCTKFKSEFPIFSKIDVNGESAAPVYEFLKSGFYGILGGDIQWNFSKFLVDKNGQPVDRYYPTTSPLTIERDIQKLLGLL